MPSHRRSDLLYTHTCASARLPRCAGATFAELHSRASDAVAQLTGAAAQFDTLQDAVTDLAAVRHVQREELTLRLEEEQRAATAAAATAAAVPTPPPRGAGPDGTGVDGSASSAVAAGGGGMAEQPPSADVTKLMEMGFSRDQAEGALGTTANDLAQAIGLLLLGDTSVRSSASTAAPPSGEPSGPPPPFPESSAPPPPTVSRQPSAADAPPTVIKRLSSSGLTRGLTHTARFELPTVLPPKVTQLIEMGFTREQAAAALQQTDGNVQEAATALLSDPNPPSAGLPTLPTCASSAQTTAPPAPAVPPVVAPPPATLPPQPSDAISDAEIAELTAMGFDAARAREALARCAGVVADAIQLLLESPEGVPLPPIAAPQASFDPFPAAVSGGPPAAPPESPAQRLMDMGFAREQAEAALARAGGDQRAALNMLLEPSPSAATAAGRPAPSVAPLATPVPAVPALVPSHSAAVPVAYPSGQPTLSMPSATGIPTTTAAVPAVPTALPPWALGTAGQPPMAVPYQPPVAVPYQPPSATHIPYASPPPR